MPLGTACIQDYRACQVKTGLIASLIYGKTEKKNTNRIKLETVVVLQPLLTLPCPFEMIIVEVVTTKSYSYYKKGKYSHTRKISWCPKQRAEIGNNLWEQCCDRRSCFVTGQLLRQSDSHARERNSDAFHKSTTQTRHFHHSGLARGSG